MFNVKIKTGVGEFCNQEKFKTINFHIKLQKIALILDFFAFKYLKSFFDKLLKNTYF